MPGFSVRNGANHTWMERVLVGATVTALKPGHAIKLYTGKALTFRAMQPHRLGTVSMGNETPLH